MYLNEVRDTAYGTAVGKGWWDDTYKGDETVIPEKLMLIVSEASEALESYRDDQMMAWSTINGKPCGFPSELADIIIRVADLAGHLSIDLEWAVEEKMRFNQSREHRHGGKRC